MERTRQIREKTFSEFNVLGCKQEKKSLTHIHREILYATSEDSLSKEGGPSVPRFLLSKQAHRPLPMPSQNILHPSSWPLSSKSQGSFFVRHIYSFPSVLWFCSVSSASSITCPPLGANPFSTQFQADNTAGSFLELATSPFTSWGGGGVTSLMGDQKAQMRYSRLSNSLLPLRSGAAPWVDVVSSDLHAIVWAAPSGPQRCLSCQCGLYLLLGFGISQNPCTPTWPFLVIKVIFKSYLPIIVAYFLLPPPPPDLGSVWEVPLLWFLIKGSDITDICKYIFIYVSIQTD